MTQTHKSSLTPLIAANWKMHGDMSWIDKVTELDALLPKNEREHVDLLLCPPFTMVSTMHVLGSPLSIYIGAQNCHADVSGAHTGEVSAEMLADAGASYVIIGHSERRAAGETNADVRAKAEAAKRAGLTAIVCVGESLAQREVGEAIATVLAQIEASVPDFVDVIAYEPIWAIGTGKVPTMDDIADMHAAIRSAVGPNVRILYGGSVKPANAQDILAVANVNGALIGGASLEMDSLAAIARSAPRK
ncbi:triose-phosphate isomerase [Litorimonas sp. RW-G-Af-16]|uniref:triose-phosphate isomerase n=1 Tax=Litorimonas sp. RW-G-Af-16 TaxID=3241168 RepID=UPI00390C57EA